MSRRRRMKASDVFREAQFVFGGVLPDILEPPTDPWHRGPFHIGGVLCGFRSSDSH